MKKKPRILFLLHLPPPVHGSSVVGLSIKESSTLNENIKGYYINLLASQSLDESGFVNIKKLLGFVIILIKVFFLIIKKRPQICYFALTISGAAFYRDLLLVVLIKFFRIKIIYHLHNKGVSTYEHKTFNRILYRFVFKNTEVILLSNLLYPDVQAFVPRHKVHICPNGTPEQNKNFDSTFINESNSSDHKKTVQILFFSNLIKSKGVYILLDACALLKKKGIQFECVFIGGEGDINATLLNKYIKDLDLCQHVCYLGEKFGIEKNKAFESTDIFVFPTYFETFGLVNIEAMQYSKPVISTYEGGIPDIIENNITGFLIPQQNCEILAEKLEILIKDPILRNKMGTAGRKRYEERFTTKKVR